MIYNMLYHPDRVSKTIYDYLTQKQLIDTMLPSARCLNSFRRLTSADRPDDMVRRNAKYEIN